VAVGVLSLTALAAPFAVLRWSDSVGALMLLAALRACTAGLKRESNSVMGPTPL